MKEDVDDGGDIDDDEDDGEFFWGDELLVFGLDIWLCIVFCEKDRDFGNWRNFFNCFYNG